MRHCGLTSCGSAVLVSLLWCDLKRASVVHVVKVGWLGVGEGGSPIVGLSDTPTLSLDWHHPTRRARGRPLPPLWSPSGVHICMRSHSRPPLDYFSQVGCIFLLTKCRIQGQARRSLVRQRPFGACFPHSFPSTRASSSHWVCIPVRMRPLNGRVELSRLPVRGAFAQRVFRPRRQRVVNRAVWPMEWRGALVPNRVALALLSCGV